MSSITASRRIKAPLKIVFRTISDASKFAEVAPAVKRIEFLTDQREGVGTRTRETREMGGREDSVELEVTEYVENDRIRFVSDSGGTIWDTLFEVEQFSESVLMTLTMDVRPHTMLARVTSKLVRGAVKKGIEADMDAVKEHCEASVSG